MVWAQEQGFEHAVQAGGSAPTATSEPGDEVEEAYVPFVQGGEVGGAAGARGSTGSGVEPEVAVVAVSAEQLEAQRRLVQGTYLPFPFPYSGGDGRERRGELSHRDGRRSRGTRGGGGTPLPSPAHRSRSRSLLFVGIDAEWKAVVPQYGGSAFQPLNFLAAGGGGLPTLVTKAKTKAKGMTTLTAGCSSSISTHSPPQRRRTRATTAIETRSGPVAGGELSGFAAPVQQ